MACLGALGGTRPFGMLSSWLSCTPTAMPSMLAACSSTDPGDPGLQGGTDGAFYCALCQVGPGLGHAAAVSRTQAAGTTSSAPVAQLLKLSAIHSSFCRHT